MKEKMKSNNKDLLMMDFDGVIYDCSKAYISGLSALYKNGFADIHIDTKEKFRKHGFSNLDGWYRLFGVKDQKKANEAFFESFNEVYDDGMFYEGIEELIREANEHFKHVAIVSSNSYDMVARRLKKINLFDYFDPIINYDSVSKLKPDIEPLVLCMNVADVIPDQVISVGDVPSDIVAARNINAKKVYCVSYGLADREILEKYKPDGIADSVDGLKKLLFENEKDR